MQNLKNSWKINLVNWKRGFNVNCKNCWKKFNKQKLHHKFIKSSKNLNLTILFLIQKMMFIVVI